MSLLAFALGQLYSGICTWEKRRNNGRNAMLVFARMHEILVCVSAYGGMEHLPKKERRAGVARYAHSSLINP